MSTSNIILLSSLHFYSSYIHHLFIIQMTNIFCMVDQREGRPWVAIHSNQPDDGFPFTPFFGLWRCGTVRWELIVLMSDRIILELASSSVVLTDPIGVAALVFQVIAPLSSVACKKAYVEPLKFVKASSFQC